MDIKRVKRRTKTHEMEYEDAPSGYVTMYNYKEPFMKFTEGHGIRGALLFDGASDTIQCHFCGKWFENLGAHTRTHGISASEYKIATGLNKSTALINEKQREKLIVSGLDKRLQNLRQRKGAKVREEIKQKIRQTLINRTMETKNRVGTCPEQLIHRLKQLYLEKGENFRLKDINFHEALVRTYGSMKTACELAQVPYRQPGSTVKNSQVPKINKEKAIEWVKEYYLSNDTLPKFSEIPKNIYKHVSKDKEKIFKESILRSGIYRPVDINLRYTKEELLEWLRLFKKVNGRKPSYSDSKRGLIPNLSRYSYHFGSWQKALSIAFNK